MGPATQGLERGRHPKALWQRERERRGREHRRRRRRRRRGDPGCLFVLLLAVEEGRAAGPLSVRGVEGRQQRRCYRCCCRCRCRRPRGSPAFFYDSCPPLVRALFGRGHLSRGPPGLSARGDGRGGLGDAREQKRFRPRSIGGRRRRVFLGGGAEFLAHGSLLRRQARERHRRGRRPFPGIERRGRRSLLGSVGVVVGAAAADAAAQGHLLLSRS